MIIIVIILLLLSWRNIPGRFRRGCGRLGARVEQSGVPVQCTVRKGGKRGYVGALPDDPFIARVFVSELSRNSLAGEIDGRLVERPLDEPVEGFPHGPY